MKEQAQQQRLQQDGNSLVSTAGCAAIETGAWIRYLRTSADASRSSDNALPAGEATDQLLSDTLWWPLWLAVAALVELSLLALGRQKTHALLGPLTRRHLARRNNSGSTTTKTAAAAVAESAERGSKAVPFTLSSVIAPGPPVQISAARHEHGGFLPTIVAETAVAATAALLGPSTALTLLQLYADRSHSAANRRQAAFRLQSALTHIGSWMGFVAAAADLLLRSCMRGLSLSWLLPSPMRRLLRPLSPLMSALSLVLRVVSALLNWARSSLPLLIPGAPALTAACQKGVTSMQPSALDSGLAHEAPVESAVRQPSWAQIAQRLQHCMVFSSHPASTFTAADVPGAITTASARCVVQDSSAQA